MTVAFDTLDSSLAPVRTMLAAGGHELVVTLNNQDIVLEILSTPDACEKCLVPAATIEAVARNCLTEADIPGDGYEITVLLPAELKH